MLGATVPGAVSPATDSRADAGSVRTVMTEPDPPPEHPPELPPESPDPPPEQPPLPPPPSPLPPAFGPAGLAGAPFGDGDGDLLDDFPRASGGRRAATALVGLVVIAALVLAMVVAIDSPSGDGGEDASAPPTTEAEPATEAEVEAAVADISDFVAEQRGVEFKDPVKVELVGEGDFQDRLLDDFDEDVEDLRTTEVFLKGLGLVDPEVDMVESVRSLLGGGVVGFYDTETKELVVRGTALTPYVRTTIAHELTHALDDQHLDLDRPEYDDAAGEIGFGFDAVVEGNARRVEDAYRESFSAEDRADASSEELALGGDMDLGDVPLVLLDLISAPYSLGQRLVEGLAGEGGEDAVNTAFTDPPTTSEQVLDPESYADREPAVEVTHPEVAGDVVDEGVVGELLVLLVLADKLGMEPARAAADGWGGDWGVAWRDGDRSCVTAVLVGDDAGETAEMLDAFDQWAAAEDASYEASVTPGGSGGAFTVESCAV